MKIKRRECVTGFADSPPRSRRELFVPRSSEAHCQLFRIEGRVQGVGYREACVQQARALGLAGYVRNRRDGSVEVMLQGDADAVVRMRAWLYEGPPLAHVDRVTVLALPARAALLDRFERRPTA
jgi:acylphosphatase